MPPTDKPENIKYRLLEIRADDPDGVNIEARTVPLAISSEEPYQRWDGVEILGHAPGEIRLDRLMNNAPLLDMHDRYEQIGVILPESVNVADDGVLRATAKISRSAKGEEILNDIVDGIRTKVSVGYIEHKRECEEDEEKRPTGRYRLIDWEPYEVSIVSMAADETVGVGKMAAVIESTYNPDYRPGDLIHPNGWTAGGKVYKIIVSDSSTGTGTDYPPDMDPAGTPPAPVEPAAEAAKPEQGNQRMEDLKPGGPEPATPDNVVEIERTARETERRRMVEIDATAKRYPQHTELAEKAKAEGWPLDRFREELLNAIESAPVPTASVGMSKKEIGEYSLMRLIKSIADKTPDASLEREISADLAKRFGPPRGVYVPDDLGIRTLSVGSDGDLVGTDHRGDLFIDVLRNVPLVQQMGARMLMGLVGDVDIPRKTAASSITWDATETTDATESEPTFDSVSLSPKTAAAYTDMTRKLTLQSDPSVEDMIRQDLREAVILGVDFGAINGSGSDGEPTGILQTSGIGDVSLGTTGGPPTYAKIVEVWQNVAQDNALMGNLGWLTNAKAIGKMATVDIGEDTGKHIFDLNTIGPDGFGRMLGYRVGISNQVPSDLVETTTDLSALIFGNWSDLLIGQWGALDLVASREALLLSGGIRIVVHMSIDVAVRHPESFAAIQDMNTT